VTDDGAFIVADCCVNWRSLPELAVLIQVCKGAGADAAKVQVFSEKDIADHPRAAELRRLILTEEDLAKIRQTCDRVEIPLGVTVTDAASVEWAAPLAQYLKIRYADRYNEELVDTVLETGKEVHLSCDQQYVNDPVTAEVVANPRVSLLYCVPEYPPTEPPVWPDFYTKFAGFSSHYPDLMVPYIAWREGARILEVHVKFPGYSSEWVPIDGAVSLSAWNLKTLREYTAPRSGFGPATEVQR
jgi:sialic acid synthase SpsE